MILRGNGFCPGHITGFFTIHDEGSNVLKKGSRGAGVNLSLGVMSMVALVPPEEKGDRTPLELDLDVKGVNEFEVNKELYRLVLNYLIPDSGMGWKATVKVRLQLPVGQGFGMSGAGALSTAIAIWEAFYSSVQTWDRRLRFKAQMEKFFSLKTDEFKVKPLKRRLLSPMQLYMGDKQEEEQKPVTSSGMASGMIEQGGGVKQAVRWLDNSEADNVLSSISYLDCISAAHRADILSWGGLGDVISQARGGIEIRLAPGIPPFGEVHTVPVGLDDTPSIAFIILGDEIKTGSVIDNPLKKRRINEAGENALRDIIQAPTLDPSLRVPLRSSPNPISRHFL